DYLALVAPAHALFGIDLAGTEIFRLRSGGRRTLVDRRLFPGLGGAIRHRPLCLPADAGAPDGSAVSLALRAQRLAGLGGAALSSKQISTVVEGKPWETRHE